MDRIVLVVVTGATGYIGKAVLDRLVSQNIPFVPLSRRPISSSMRWRYYDLARPLEPGILDDATAVIHLAAETDQGPSADLQREVTAVSRLIDAGRSRNIKIVFVSSQTAQERAPTNYGRAKWLCEQRVLASDDIVVRPGQVYGGAELGSFGQLCRSVRAARFIPRILPEPQLQPIHVDDLARALVECAIRKNLGSRIYELGAPIPVKFTAFLKSLSKIRYDRKVVSIFAPISAVIAIMGVPGLPTSVHQAAQRLESLRRLPLMQTGKSLDELKIVLRPLSEGLRRSSSGRRRLLIEARTLIHYVLHGIRPVDCLRHYVRAIEVLDDGQTLVINWIFRRWPALLWLVDQPRSVSRNTFRARLDLATICGESSIKAVDRFITFEKRPRSFELLGLGWQIMLELCRGSIRLLFGFGLNRLRPRLINERRST